MTDPISKSAQFPIDRSVEKEDLDDLACANASNTNQTKKWYRETAHRQAKILQFSSQFTI